MSDITDEQRECFALDIMGVYGIMVEHGALSWRLNHGDKWEPMPDADSWLFLGPLLVALVTEHQCHFKRAPNPITGVKEIGYWREGDIAFVTEPEYPEAIIAAALAVLESKDAD